VVIRVVSECGKCSPLVSIECPLRQSAELPKLFFWLPFPLPPSAMSGFGDLCECLCRQLASHMESVESLLRVVNGQSVVTSEGGFADGDAAFSLPARPSSGLSNNALAMITMIVLFLLFLLSLRSSLASNTSQRNQHAAAVEVTKPGRDGSSGSGSDGSGPRREGGDGSGGAVQ